MSSDNAGASGGGIGALKGFLGLDKHTGAGPSAPRPIKTPPHRADSLPEIVTTPSEIGVFETSHSHGTKGNLWQRWFENPGARRLAEEKQKQQGQQAGSQPS